MVAMCVYLLYAFAAAGCVRGEDRHTLKRTPDEVNDG
jgi:hypothetical protein